MGLGVLKLFHLMPTRWNIYELIDETGLSVGCLSSEIPLLMSDEPTGRRKLNKTIDLQVLMHCVNSFIFRLVFSP